MDRSFAHWKFVSKTYVWARISSLGISTQTLSEADSMSESKLTKI